MADDRDRFEAVPAEAARRLKSAMASSSDVARAEAWLRSGRPTQLRELTRRLAMSYMTVENSSPAGQRIGLVAIPELAEEHPLRQTWPAPSLEARELMFRATHLYRCLGVLVAEAGSDITSSLPVLGRALLELVSQVDWLLEPAGIADVELAGRAVARRAYLLSLSGLADLAHESEDFGFEDAPELRVQLAAGRKLAAVTMFGAYAVSMTQRNPDRWTIDGESKPRKGQMVDAVGGKIFSLGVARSSHYRMPSSSAHGTLGAPVGKPVPIPGPDNVYVLACLDVESVEGWLWYYTVWYRHGTRLMARAHRWPESQIAQHDLDARSLFGRQIVSGS
jgi:hypothetical protein